MAKGTLQGHNGGKGCNLKYSSDATVRSQAPKIRAPAGAGDNVKSSVQKVRSGKRKPLFHG